MAKITITDKNLVNLSEASRQLGISYMTLWRWIKRGKVTPIRIATLPYFTLDQLEAMKRNLGK